MAAISRGTPNFTAPPSQNTAPVDEFRCLFTHDIRKKQKKWHDGVVKFHTFNRRVMVYDDARNYVGDLHYRGDEHFGEGVELQLDRGVMIEVGEPLGRTQTDVTELVNRGHGRGDTAAVSGTSSTVQPVRRINTTDSHGRPKSLAEVLGASQGRLGRARLPVQSPFEQRQVMAEAHSSPPPAKKQKTMSVQDMTQIAQPTPTRRTATGKEKFSAQTRVSPKPQHFPQDPVVQQSVLSTIRAPENTSSGQRTLPKSPDVIDISSDEDIPQVGRTGQSRAQKEDSHRASEQSIRTISKTKEKLVKPSKHKQKERPNKADSGRVEKPTEKALMVSSVLYSNPGDTSKPNSRQASTTLRFAASTKTRPKLMYKALLPSSATRTASRSTSHDSSHLQERNIQPVSASEVREIVDDEHDFLSGSGFEVNLENVDIDLGNSPPKEDSPVAGDNLDTRSNHPSPVQASALFVSQTNSQQHSPFPDPVSEVDNLGISFTQELSNFDTNNPLEDQQENAPLSDTSTHESIVLSSPTSPTGLALPAAIEESPPRIPTKVTTVAPRPPSSPERRSNVMPPTSIARAFRRVVSENDSTNFMDHLPSTTVPPANRPPTIETPLRPGPIMPPAETSPSLLRRRSPTKHSPIRRSFSDPQAIIPQPLEIETADTTMKPTDEQGPWTKLEAYLLFDTWPESKKANKPVFERPAGVPDDDDLNAHVLSKVNTMGKFRSARMVLRDEE